MISNPISNVKSFYLNIISLLLVWLFFYWFKSNFLNRILCSFSINFPFTKKKFPSLMKNFSFSVFFAFLMLNEFAWNKTWHNRKVDELIYGAVLKFIYWYILASCYYRLSFFCLCAFRYKYLQYMRLDMEIFFSVYTAFFIYSTFGFINVFMYASGILDFLGQFE